MYVPSSNLIKLFQEGRAFCYEKEDIIIRSGDIPSGVYYIASGWIKVYSLCKNGEPNIIMTLYPGEVFPVAWAVTGLVRDINYAAVGNTKAFRISKERFIQATNDDGAIRLNVLYILSRHFFNFANELDNLQYRSAREKIVFRLIMLASKFGKHSGKEIIIDTKIPNEYIARSTNMTRETASREISRLARKQLIYYHNGKIHIPDLDRLKNEIDSHFNLKTLSLE